jgi:hypothetical protein
MATASWRFAQLHRIDLTNTPAAFLDSRLAVVALVDLAMQPQLEGPPLQDNAALHGVPLPPEHARP